jgi:UDP-N-acetyl-D-mannosaminuronate dehydrogenase
MAMEGVAELDPALRAADCVVVATDHGVYDWAYIHRTARLLVDTRRAVRETHMAENTR